MALIPVCLWLEALFRFVGDILALWRVESIGEVKNKLRNFRKKKLAPCEGL